MRFLHFAPGRYFLGAYFDLVVQRAGLSTGNHFRARRLRAKNSYLHPLQPLRLQNKRCYIQRNLISFPKLKTDTPRK